MSKRRRSERTRGRRVWCWQQVTVGSRESGRNAPKGWVGLPSLLPSQMKSLAWQTWKFHVVSLHPYVTPGLQPLRHGAFQRHRCSRAQGGLPWRICSWTFLAAFCTMEGGFESSGLRSEERRCPRNSEIFGRPALRGPWSQKIWIAQWSYETGWWAFFFITHVLVPSCWCFYWVSVCGDLLCDWHNSTLQDLRLERCWLTSARSLCPSPGIFCRKLFGVSRTHLSPSTLTSSAKWWREGCPVGWVDRSFFSVEFFGGTVLK